MFDQMPKAESVTTEVATRPDGIKSPGDEFNEKVDWAEILKPLGWTVVYQKGEATVWRRPGKSEGISATTNFNGNGKLYVFSTSTVFDSETSYSKFAAFAHLNHGGDFKAAAAHLRTQGYGPQGLNSFDSSNSLMPKHPLEPLIGAASSTVDEDNSTWRPIELKDYYDGLFQQPIATILKRSDGAGLIYQGRVHSIYGESESGKSWIAQIATAELLKSDKKVIYIDFESDALDIDKSGDTSPVSLDLSGSPYDGTLVGKAAATVKLPTGDPVLNLTAPTAPRGNLGLVVFTADSGDFITVNVGGLTYTGTGGVSITLNKAGSSAGGGMLGPKYDVAGGSGPDLSDADPEDLGTADPGTSPDASRADHVHATEVGDAIADGVTDLAPSQNAVYDALAGKAPIANAVHTGTFEVVTAKHTGNTGASTTPLLITGANASGAPASGAHVKGEIAGDDTGKLWYCTVAGTPGTWVAIGGSGVAADPIFDAKGDLPVGTGADTAAKLTVGANGQVPMADSGATTGLRYGTPAAPAGSHAMPYVSGKVYAVPRRTFGTASYAANYVRLMPYVPHATNTFDRIQFYATSTGSGNARLGIFNSDGANGYASTLLIDAGQTATTSGGDLLSPSFSQVLTVGVLYWIGVNVNVTTVLAHRDCTTQGSAGVGFGGIGSDTLPYEHCYAAQTYGAMPSTLATVTPYAASTPYLTVRSA